MSHIKYILSDKANRALNGFQFLRLACVFLFIQSIAAPVYCQSEYLFEGQDAISVGVGMTRTLKGDPDVEGVNRVLLIAASPGGVFDIGATFAKNSRNRNSVTSFFAGVNISESQRKRQRNGVILFGEISAFNKDYAFGFRIYNRQNLRKDFYLVPELQGGVLSISSGPSNRNSKFFWDVGLSLGFGTSKAPLVIITPGLSKIQDTPLRIGISATLVVFFPNKPLKQKR